RSYGDWSSDVCSSDLILSLITSLLLLAPTLTAPNSTHYSIIFRPKAPIVKFCESTAVQNTGCCSFVVASFLDSCCSFREYCQFRSEERRVGKSVDSGS